MRGIWHSFTIRSRARRRPRYASLRNGSLASRAAFFAGAFVFVQATALLSPAQATDFMWQEFNGADGGAFDDPNHWSPTGFPSGSGDNATIDLLGMGAYSVFLPDNNQSANALTLDSPNLTFDNQSHQFATNGNTDVKHGQVIWANQLWRNNGGAITQTITIEAPAFFTADTNTTIRQNYINSGTTNVDGSLFFDTLTNTTNNSTFTVKVTASLNVVGSVFNQNGGSLSIAGTANVNTGGVFNYNGGTVGGTVSMVGTSTLNNGAGAGAGAFNFQFINNKLTGSVPLGQVITVESSDANGPAALAWNTTGFTNAGQIILTSTGSAARNTTLSVASPNTLVNTGQIDFKAGVGGTRFLTTDALNNSGTVNVNAITNLNGAGSALTNTGHIHIAAGSSLTMSNFGTFTQTAGETQNDGTLAVTPTSDLIKIHGGILHGVGTVNGTLQVSGTGQISPGNSIGTLSVAGNTSFSGGSLVEELGASGSPGTSDLLAITGNLTLSGTSALTLTGGSNSGFYTIATYSGTRTGTFSSVTPGYTVDYSHAGEIRVTGVPEPSTLPLLAIAGSVLLLAGGRRTRTSAIG